MLDVDLIYAEAGLSNPSLDLDVALIGEDGTGAKGNIFFGDPSLLENNPEYITVNLPTGSWLMAIQPKGGWPTQPDNLWKNRALYLLAGLFVVIPTFIAGQISVVLESERGNFAPLMGEDLADAPLGSLSVENSTWPQNPFHMPLEEAAIVGEEFEDNGRTWLGYYHEPRLIYAEPAFRKGPWKASDRRTVHLAVDAFA